MLTTITPSSVELKQRLHELAVTAVEGNPVDGDALRDVLFELGLTKPDFDRLVGVARQRRHAWQQLQAESPSEQIAALNLEQQRLEETHRRQAAELEQRLNQLRLEHHQQVSDVAAKIERCRDAERAHAEARRELIASADPSVADQLRRLNEAAVGIESRSQSLNDTPIGRRDQTWERNFSEQRRASHGVQRERDQLLAKQLDWHSFAV